MAYLTKWLTPDGTRWALDGRLLANGFALARLLEHPANEIDDVLRPLVLDAAPAGMPVAPVDDDTEVWAAGVTYRRSREAREAESTVKDVYSRVYEAARPELFFKATGWRVAGPGMPIRVRRDSRWNVPEPELTLVITSRGEIAGFCAGNDVSSRDIEGENPLYLPQAKIYNGSCALGPGISLCDADALRDLAIAVTVSRQGGTLFAGTTSTAHLNRSLQDLVDYLGRELDFPAGVLLMTGTGIVPPDDFTLQPGDAVRIQIGSLVLENEVA